MSSSSGLAAAKRRRGGTQQNVQNVQQEQEEVQEQQPAGALTVPQSIYLLSNRIAILETQLFQSVSYLEGQLTQKATDNSLTNNQLSDTNRIISDNNNNGIQTQNINTDDFITKIDFNDVMTNIGSDMNELSQKMSTLNEFVLSVQNSYLTLNNTLLQLQNKATDLATNNNEENMSLVITEKSDLADFTSIEEGKEEEEEEQEHEQEQINKDRGFVDSDEDNDTKEVVSADITSRLKQLSVKTNNTTEKKEEEIAEETNE